MCGEKVNTALMWQFNEGSPPRVRGKVFNACPACVLVGITPACAGKRSLHRGTKFVFWDHPRVCGEKTSKALKIKHLYEAVLQFYLTSDRSHRSAGSSSVLPMPLYPLYPDYSESLTGAEKSSMTCTL